jgi:hypothetical protein
MQNISSLAHAEFLKASNAGSVDVSVHRQLAAHVMDTSLMPKDYRLAYRMWTWIWLSLVPVALAIGSLYPWWWTPALVALLVMAQAITRSRTATSFIVDYAREDELFYDIMVQLGVMRVSENPRTAG